MFPDTDDLASIISQTEKVLFRRRLIDRVLRVWSECRKRRAGGGFRVTIKSSPRSSARTG